jgi:hypothetical protein
MAKDAISKRVARAVSFVSMIRERLDGGDVAALVQGVARARDSTFELFGLDPKKPRDHQFLLYLLDRIIFGKRRVGAPRKWREWGEWGLRADVATVNHGSKKKSVRETCRILIEDKDKKFEGRYANLSPEALRHKVRDIKKPLGDN